MKIKLNDGFVDSYGNVVFNEDGLVNLLLSGYVTENVLTDIEDIDTYNSISEGKVVRYTEPLYDLEEYHHKRSNTLLIPEEYKKLNIRDYVISLCHNDNEVNRVSLECDIMEKSNMVNFFRVMVYIVDTFRKNNIVWGVGRGSSCASYVLYKIGVHKIDCIKYDIDYNEFFKGDINER